MSVLKCLRTIWLHKYFVLRAGLDLQVPLCRLLVHDLSKLLPDELPHYANKFHGAGDDPAGFAECWRKHQMRNPHHWQHWVMGNKTHPMPWWAVREMVTDWMAAGRAYNGRWPDLNTWPWLEENYPTMVLHPTTELRLNIVIRKARRKQNEQ